MIVLGGGNTAMDCCRTSRRLGGEDVKVVVRSGFEEMKASPWEKDDAMGEGIPILNFMVPKEFTHTDGKLTGVLFEKVKAERDAKGRRNLVPTGEPDVHIECDDVLVAVGQENAFPGSSATSASSSTNGTCRSWTRSRSSRPIRRSSSAATRPSGPRTSSGRWRTATPRRVSIDLLCNGHDVKLRPADPHTLASQKMGIHEWSYDNDVSLDLRFKVPHAPHELTLHNVNMEVELGFTKELGFKEAQRCLNCDVETVFEKNLCIECDACVDICPVDCITFTPNDPEGLLRTHLTAPATDMTQDLYVSITSRPAA